MTTTPNPAELGSLRGKGGPGRGQGRKQSETFAERYAAEPDGSSIIRLPNVVLAYFERQAQSEGLGVAQYLGRMEIQSRIV